VGCRFGPSVLARHPKPFAKTLGHASRDACPQPLCRRARDDHGSPVACRLLRTRNTNPLARFLGIAWHPSPGSLYCCCSIHRCCGSLHEFTAWKHLPAERGRRSFPTVPTLTDRLAKPPTERLLGGPAPAHRNTRRCFRRLSGTCSEPPEHVVSPRARAMTALPWTPPPRRNASAFLPGAFYLQHTPSLGRLKHPPDLRNLALPISGGAPAHHAGGPRPSPVSHPRYRDGHVANHLLSAPRFPLVWCLHTQGV